MPVLAIKQTFKTSQQKLCTGNYQEKINNYIASVNYIN